MFSSGSEPFTSSSSSSNTTSTTTTTTTTATTSLSNSNSNSNSSSTSPPQSPSRLNFPRLRGLSYLRSCTQHLHLRFDSDSRSREPQPASSQTPIDSLFPASPLTSRLLPPSPSSPQNQAYQPASADLAFQSSPTSPTSPRGWWFPISAPKASNSYPAANSLPTANIESGTSVANFESVEVPLPPASLMTRNSDEPMSVIGKESQQLPSIRFIPHQDPRASRPSLTFQALSRTLPTPGAVIKVGRYSERDAQPGEIPRNTPSSAPVGFKSKVVSRRHCEFWYENSQWFVKDVKSSSGTFLNHLRLSPPGVESRPWPINDGDVVQLGIDFRGGEEMIFRCVKIRIELNRGWQKALNNFNKSTHRRLQKLQEPGPKRDSDNTSLSSSECAICLVAVAPCQSLFVAPCSHVWHFKCIRPILNGPNYPQFLCPNCRAVTDLEADIEEAESDWEEDLKEAIEASKTESVEKRQIGEVNGVREMQNKMDTDGDSPMPDAVHAPPARPAPLPPAVEFATAGAEQGQRPSNLPNSIHPPQQENGISTTAALPIPGRNVSPGTRRYELMTNGVSEGPQTPRNDAGPFVLDGGAGLGAQPPTNGTNPLA